MANIDFQQLGENFGLSGVFVEAASYGSGHINDTYRSAYDQSGVKVQYIHQRINTDIFAHPKELMSNIVRVTEHQRKSINSTYSTDAARRALRVVSALNGDAYYVDDQGRYWRTYEFIEGARTFDKIESPEQARNAAAAFGEFQQQMADFPGPRLFETIPNFHDTRSRFNDLIAAVDADSCARHVACAEEVEFALSQEAIVDVVSHLLASGDIPERVVHNDTKLNNVMLDDITGEGVCVIDLDTVMPGTALSDFGDMVRTATMSAAEDETNLSKVGMDLKMFEALAQGFLSRVGDQLTSTEIEHLAFSGQLITVEVGLRFLTDFLAGDTYFKTSRAEHNLDRCRTQFALARSIQAQLNSMRSCVIDVLSARKSERENSGGFNFARWNSHWRAIQ